MIPPQQRFFVNEGMCSPVPTGPCTWEVIDWDRRRWLRIHGPKNAFPEDDYIEEFAARYADQVGEDEQTLTSNEHRELIGVSSDDPTWEIRYPHYVGPLDEETVIFRSNLKEVERLDVATDLVEDSQTDGVTKQLVFKYTLIQTRVENVWQELHILKALQGNKRFVPFYRIVLDEVTHNILGFTTKYIPGGTLEQYRGTFYFRWLKQLTDAVDELNLRYGLMHQDLAPRNILIDPTTQELLVFDFDRSGQIGGKGASRGCNDVDALVFTIYETLTLDESFREGLPWEQDVSKVENMKKWELKLPLEDGVDIAVYRDFLARWADERRTTRTIKHFSEASEPLTWPEYGKLEMIEVPADEYGVRMSLRRKRKQVEGAGGYVTRWERAAQEAIKGYN
ncbi:hypothetical protein TRV_04794 [Trichophyton verrucosum HKI 0517]|uniref:EKC/KEOPS complex subunit BUD32 n=1 Tax=Trichophyton verrucosum (strain HKI 0517) TaxID=663202 RepID=D4DCE1_TRIVH|nr:uncharacterized protein TRV_04794 [Trichophyton verrucosum HKI 0517]EFE40463.1 hypothetical protein TRV_04794 [Trichophyton verrucosum HKI 0517]